MLKKNVELGTKNIFLKNKLQKNDILCLCIHSYYL